MLEGIVKDLDRIERGYMLTKDTSYQRQLLSTVEKITPLTDTLKLLIADNDVHRKNLVLGTERPCLEAGLYRRQFCLYGYNPQRSYISLLRPWPQKHAGEHEKHQGYAGRRKYTDGIPSNQ